MLAISKSGADLYVIDYRYYKSSCRSQQSFLVGKAGYSMKNILSG